MSVPLDLSNPETLEYQMEVAVLPAAQDGYNAIALDNYGLANTWKACGSFKGPNGTWVQMYGNGGVAPEDDPQYTADVLNWTARAVDQIHGAGLLVIPNFSDLNLEDEGVLTMSNLTDGILSEGASLALCDWRCLLFASYACLCRMAHTRSRLRFVGSCAQHNQFHNAASDDEPRQVQGAGGVHPQYAELRQRLLRDQRVGRWARLRSEPGDDSVQHHR